MAEPMTAEELRERVREVQHLTAPGLTQQWRVRRSTIRGRILKGKVEEFLRWPVIRSSMFVGNAPYTPKQLHFLREPGAGWSRYYEAIQEDDFGGVERLPRPRHWTSGNLINQATHLRQFEREMTVDIRDFPVIADFGSGYGASAKIIRRLGFEGTLVTYDIPEMALLQRYYLSNCGITDVHSLYDLDEFMDHLTDGGLFMSICAFSETKESPRWYILNGVRAGGYLIVYSPTWEGVDNEQFFSQLMDERPQMEWRQGQSVHIHCYVMGVER